MREIKFRGKRIDTGEWVYGWYVGYSESMGYIYGDYIDKDEVWQVDASTVSQYTGLKDINGKEIYEGDILHCWGGEYCQGYWEFDTKFAIKNLINDCFMLGESEFIEVIGNKWDNPELHGTKKRMFAR